MHRKILLPHTEISHHKRDERPDEIHLQNAHNAGGDMMLLYHFPPFAKRMSMLHTMNASFVLTSASSATALKGKGASGLSSSASYSSSLSSHAGRGGGGVGEQEGRGEEGEEMTMCDKSLFELRCSCFRVLPAPSSSSS